MRHLQHEARFASLLDALFKIAGRGGFDDACDFLFGFYFHGAVEPLDDAAKPIAVVIGDGVGDEPHMQAADLDLGAMLALELRQKLRCLLGSL